MTLSGLFDYLGAPLANVRWSWGAVRPSDSAVFLRVWQDEVKKINGKRFARVISVFEGSNERLGHAERVEQVARIRAGARSYMVMCLAKDAKASPREILSFNEDDIFIGGELVDADGCAWLELADRKPILAARA